MSEFTCTIEMIPLLKSFACPILSSASYSLGHLGELHLFTSAQNLSLKENLKMYDQILSFYSLSATDRDSAPRLAIFIDSTFAK